MTNEHFTVADKRCAVVKKDFAVTDEGVAATDESLILWRRIIELEGRAFTTSGRGTRPGVRFTYSVSRTEGQKGGGRRFAGESVDGYGNELWITTDDGVKKKSISRSTVDLAYRRAMESGGFVSGPKKLNIPGAGSYVFSIFREIGIIKN